MERKRLFYDGTTYGLEFIRHSAYNQTRLLFLCLALPPFNSSSLLPNYVSVSVYVFLFSFRFTDPTLPLPLSPALFCLYKCLSDTPKVSD